MSNAKDDEQSEPSERKQKDPLHGLTLETVLKRLVGHYGWEGLASRIKIRCFMSNPGFSSSLKFLRSTPWARKELEELYVRSFSDAVNR